jgi:glycosyltransferase involved in cell wall biosynthesis
MKIAIIQPRISYYNGGGEIFPMQFMVELTRRIDIEIHLYTLKAPVKETSMYTHFKETATRKIHIFEYPIPQNFRYLYNIEPGENRYRWDTESLYFNSLIFPDFFKNTEDLLWSYYNYDGVIHPINMPAILNLLGYPRMSVPYAKALIDQFTATVSISTNVANKWEEMVGSKLKNNFVSRPVVSVTREPVVNKKLFDGPGPHIVFAGRLIQRKGLIILVNAIALLKEKNPNIKVYILGEGPYKEDLINHIVDLHLQSVIILLGHKDNVGDYFLNADVCIFPSEAGEGLMNTVLEAMYCGGVVITTTDNGNEEILKNHEEGLIVEAGNELMLAQSIQFAISNTKWTQQVRINAKKRARQNFTWDKYIKDIETVIQNTLKLTHKTSMQ